MSEEKLAIQKKKKKIKVLLTSVIKTKNCVLREESNCLKRVSQLFRKFNLVVIYRKNLKGEK